MPTDARAAEIHQLANRLVNLRGGRTEGATLVTGHPSGRFTSGRLSIQQGSKGEAVWLSVLDKDKGWQVVYNRVRDYDAERGATNREFGSLGIPVSGSATYWKISEYDASLADEAIRLLQQELVLDELSQVLNGEEEEASAADERP
ncbi:MAG: hypothetical protein AB7V39_11885 [Nitrospiraceae bacterium]